MYAAPKIQNTKSPTWSQGLDSWKSSPRSGAIGLAAQVTAKMTSNGLMSRWVHFLLSMERISFDYAPSSIPRRSFQIRTLRVKSNGCNRAIWVRSLPWENLCATIARPSLKGKYISPYHCPSKHPNVRRTRCLQSHTETKMSYVLCASMFQQLYDNRLIDHSGNSTQLTFIHESHSMSCPGKVLSSQVNTGNSIVT